MDLTILTDEELNQLHIDVLNEQEHRTRLVQLPKQMEEMIARFIEDGGKLTDIDAAVTRGKERKK